MNNISICSKCQLRFSCKGVCPERDTTPVKCLPNPHCGRCKEHQKYNILQKIVKKLFDV